METSRLSLQRSFVHQMALEWVSAWNSHDLERILGHYEDDIVLISPVAAKLLQNDGVVRGKPALRQYFARGLEAYPEVHFELIDVLWGVETMVLYYSNTVRGTKAAEVMELSAAGRIRRVWGNYDN